jgi:hypothetical protein
VRFKLMILRFTGLKGTALQKKLDGIADHEGYAKPRYYWLTDRCPKCIETWRHAAQDNKQRLLRTIERRFSRQTFHAGEAVAIRSYVGT